MRLSEREISSICKIILGEDPSAEVYLFGSRADFNKKGGDIDLLIISQIIDGTAKRRIHSALQDALGEQKIDILLVNSPKDEEKPIIKIARESAIKLCPKKI